MVSGGEGGDLASLLVDGATVWVNFSSEEGLQAAWLGLEAEETRVHGRLLPAESLDSFQSQDLELRLKS